MSKICDRLSKDKLLPCIKTRCKSWSKKYKDCWYIVLAEIEAKKSGFTVEELKERKVQEKKENKDRVPWLDDKVDELDSLDKEDNEP